MGHFIIRAADAFFITPLREPSMPLTQSDRQLLVRCIEGQPFAWHTFVDRFIGLMMLVVDQTAKTRSVELNEKNREELAAEIFTEIMRDDFQLLRDFESDCSLDAYLTVIARRIVANSMDQRLQGSDSSAEMRWN